MKPGFVAGLWTMACFNHSSLCPNQQPCLTMVCWGIPIPGAHQGTKAQNKNCKKKTMEKQTIDCLLNCELTTNTNFCWRAIMLKELVLYVHTATKPDQVHSSCFKFQLCTYFDTSFLTSLDDCFGPQIIDFVEKISVVAGRWRWGTVKHDSHPL